MSPEYGSPQPPRKDVPGYSNDPFPPQAAQFNTPPAIRPPTSSNPFDPPTFTPIMSPPNHPQSPPPPEPVPPNPFLQNFTPAGPSSPSQIYLSPAVATPQPTPQISQNSNQLLNPHPLALNPSPQVLSPNLPVNPNQAIPAVPALNGIGSPVSSPIVTSDRPAVAQLQQQQLQQQLLQQNPQQPLPAQPVPQSAQSTPIPAVSSGQLQPNSAPAQPNHPRELSRASSLDDTSRMLEEVRALKSLYEMQVCHPPPFLSFSSLSLPLSLLYSIFLCSIPLRSLSSLSLSLSFAPFLLSFISRIGSL